MNKVIYFPHFGIPEIPEEHVSWPQGSRRLRTGASEPRLLLAPECNVNRCQKISRDAVFGSSQANVCHSKCEATAADVAGGSLKARLLGACAGPASFPSGCRWDASAGPLPQNAGRILFFILPATRWIKIFTAIGYRVGLAAEDNKEVITANYAAFSPSLPPSYDLGT